MQPPRHGIGRIAVFNDSEPILSTIVEWCEGHGCEVVTAQVSQMKIAHLDVEQFVRAERPDVIVFDVAKPYESSWDFLDLVRLMPALAGLPIIVTSPNKQALEAVVGPTSTLQCAGRSSDFQALLAAVEAAVHTLDRLPRH